MSSNPRFFDRVLETSTTTGTGTYTLGGAVTGYQSFAVLGDGNSCYYSAFQVDANGNPSGGWEIGVGTYTASGTTLSRDSIQASSNSSAAVSWADGSRRVFLVTPASYFHDGAYTSTATGNIDDLDFGTAALIRMDNASLATVRGLKAGSSGQTVRIVSVGAGQVSLAHQDSGSVAANRLINFATSAATPLAPAVGTATYQYDGTTMRWRLVEHNQGAWLTPTFAAGDFTATGGGAWTVEAADVISNSYYLQGRVLMWILQILTSSVTTTANRLNAAVPGGFTFAFDLQQANRVTEAGTSTVGVALLSQANSTTSIQFRSTIALGGWNNSTNQTQVNFFGPVAIL